MSKDNGGPAFPSETNSDYFYGMTLRDYFAAKAMQGLLADMVEETTAQKLAECSYSVADAMLQERNK